MIKKEYLGFMKVLMNIRLQMEGMTPEEFITTSRKWKYLFPRMQIAMIAKAHRVPTYTIGALLLRDHSSICAYPEKHWDMIETNRIYRGKMAEYRACLMHKECQMQIIQWKDYYIENPISLEPTREEIIEFLSEY